MELIAFDDFIKADLRVGTVREAVRVEGSNKLVRMQIDLGEEAPRQILAGIGTHYMPEGLVGKQIVVIANLAPRSLMGFESHGMVLAAGDAGPVVLTPDKAVAPGSSIH